MAGFDGSGPRGNGPMTGRAIGYCAGDVSERPYSPRAMGRGLNRRRPGLGRGVGRGVGRGMGTGYRACGRGFGRYNIDDAEYIFDSEISLEDEKAILEERLSRINSQLKKD